MLKIQLLSNKQNVEQSAVTPVDFLSILLRSGKRTGHKLHLDVTSTIE